MAIGGSQWPSKDQGGGRPQWQSMAISGSRWQSVVISGHRMTGEVGVSEGARTTFGKRVTSARKREKRPGTQAPCGGM